MQEGLYGISKYVLILLSLLILLRCLRSMLSDRYDGEIWAYLKAGKRYVPVCHWENLIGRGAGADIRLFGDGISRTHAILRRSDRGEWSVHDVFSKGGVWVNSERVPDYGTTLEHGDIINFGGSCVTFADISEKEKRRLEAQRSCAGIRVNPAVTLLELSLFQAVLLFAFTGTIDPKYRASLAVSFGILLLLEWLVFEAMRLLGRTGFEVETLAFYLTTLGVAVAASSTPEDLTKQMILVMTGVVLFVFGGWWLRKLKRTSAMRIPVAVIAVALLAVNAVAGYSEYGATNWLSVGGYSFQPSEFVKVCYIYTGAATMDTLYRKNNLYMFIGFSAVCVIALALIGDFGTALIFFVTFLVISFLRSGSIATVILAVTGAGLAGFLAVSVKPYIAQRFAIWGHVWEDVYDKGFQQTRALSASAAGGLIGKGPGNGWLKNVFAANMDMVFAMVCEELGLIVAACMVLAVVLMAFFAIREARRGRSAYYGIAACATVSMLMVQTALNVFGSLDLLPFTGVTFPFVSRGGSSLLSCWMLMAFLKSADTRKNASFAVKSVKASYDEDEPEEDYEEQEDWDGFEEEEDDRQAEDARLWSRSSALNYPDDSEIEYDAECDPYLEDFSDYRSREDDR